MQHCYRREVPRERPVRGHEHAIAAGHGQTHALVMRIAQTDGEAAYFHFGCKIEHAEHFHPVRRYRRCQAFAVYTQKHDVTARLERVLNNEGIRTAVLRASVDTSKREAWYTRQIKKGVQVVISHPKLVETGLDLLDFPTIIFYESGYSLHTLRQASRRSWRIGQRRPVRVKFLCYEGTMQTACLRLMGKKLLVALTMEGKFAGEGLQNIDEDDDMLSAMARELVERNDVATLT